MSLSALIASKSHFQAIEAYLDDLPSAQRLQEVDALSRRSQRTLYQLVEEAPPLTLDFFVPSDVGVLKEVIHHGKNTLPLLPKLRRFQKRFCRPIHEKGALYGYNESPSRPLIGPGYFLAVSTEGNSEWQQRGNIVIDYFQVPTGEIPHFWPQVKPNSAGLQKFVYNKTRDFMRRVSKHVSIGAAYKGDKALGAWFVLCREDPS